MHERIFLTTFGAKIYQRVKIETLLNSKLMFQQSSRFEVQLDKTKS